MVTRASNYKRPARPRVVISRGSSATGGKPGVYPPSKEGGNNPVSPKPSSSDVMKQCLALLKPLGANDQRKIIDQLAFDLAGNTDDPRDKDVWAREVYEAVSRAYGGSGGGLPGVMVFKKLLTAPEPWGHLTEFMQVSWRQEITVTERNAIFRMLAKLLADHVVNLSRTFGYPLTPKLVANCTGQLPSLFDQSFPGYAASGLTGVLLRSLMKGVQDVDPED